MKHFLDISYWFTTLFKAWRREMYLVFHDLGVLIFFFALPILYPIVYTLIYNPEVVHDIPVVIVDYDRSAQSRELARMVDATSAMEVYDYAPNLLDARRLMNEHKCYGILEIPDEYGRKLGRGEQAITNFYAEMNLMLRYRTFVSALTDIQMALGSKIQTRSANTIGLAAQGLAEAPVESESIMLGNPTQGFASFVMPAIVILILQQSIVLGICMLAGGQKERMRRNNGYDPLAIDVPYPIALLGKMLCILTLYIPLTFYILHIIPTWFNLPHIGNLWQIFTFVLPLLISSVFFGCCISQFVTDRESCIPVVVFSSILFLFLSGITWPRYAVNGFWQIISSFMPATWGVDGFVAINSNGATIAGQSHPYTMLWALSALYFALSWLFMRMLDPLKKHS